MEIETPVLLAYAIEDSTDIFRISGGGGVWTPQTPPSRYATGCKQGKCREIRSSGYDAVLLGERLPAFRRILVASSRRRT